MLLVEGDYPEVNPPLKFWMKFLYEGLSWKLVGFSYGLNTARPPTEGNWPDGKPL